MSGGEVQTSQRVVVEFQVGLGMVNVGFYVASIGVVLVVLAAEFGVPVESLAWLGSLYGVALIVVAFAGPPLVITSIWVNSENAEIVIVMKMKTKVGRRPGSVTLRNCCQRLAPSSAEAS